jgi:integrase
MAGRRSSGTGTISQRADGLWIGKVELPRDPRTGERRRKTVAGKTRNIVEVKIDKLRLDLRQHGDLPTATMPLSKWMDYWMNNIDQSRPKTRAGYWSKIETYIKPAIGRIRIEQLTPTDVRKLEHFIVRDKGLSSTTALQTYSILAKSLKDAQREGRVVRNVARLVNPPRKAVRKSTVLTSTEAIQLLTTISEDRLGSRWAAALLTGARQGELLGLEIDRVGDFLELSWQLQRIALRNGKLDAPADWEHRHLTGALYLSRPKSRAGWRMVPVAPVLRPVLEARLQAARAEPNPFGLVWTADPKKSRSTHELQPLDGMPIDPSKDSKDWHAVLARAGVPDVRLHDARHTAVTLLYDLDIPEVVIQQIVGQSTVAVTRGYRHASQQPAVEALNQLSRVLTAPPAQ